MALRIKRRPLTHCVMPREQLHQFQSVGWGKSMLTKFAPTASEVDTVFPQIGTTPRIVIALRLRTVLITFH